QVNQITFSIYKLRQIAVVIQVFVFCIANLYPSVLYDSAFWETRFVFGKLLFVLDDPIERVTEPRIHRVTYGSRIVSLADNGGSYPANHFVLGIAYIPTDRIFEITDPVPPSQN